MDFAREIAEDWRRRVLLRLDGGRTIRPDGSPDPDGRLLWSIYDPTTHRPEESPDEHEA